MGPGSYSIQGKTTRKYLDPVDVALQRIGVPRSIMKFYKNAELSAGSQFVNYTPFVAYVSENARRGAIGALNNLKCMSFESELESSIISHPTRCFYIALILVDIQFKDLKDRNLLRVEVNAVSKEDHVPKIERWHRMIKKRVHYYYAMLPFNSLPRMMVKHLMKTVLFYVNKFASMLGVSQIMPTLNIVEGAALDFNFHFRVIFEEFLQSFEGTDNTMIPRTIDAIAIITTGNFQVGISFFQFSNGKILNRQWKYMQTLKIPLSVICLINCMLKKQNSIKGLKFGDKKIS